jgi:hypothetical protein
MSRKILLTENVKKICTINDFLLQYANQSRSLQVPIGTGYPSKCLGIHWLTGFALFINCASLVAISLYLDCRRHLPLEYLTCSRYLPKYADSRCSIRIGRCPQGTLFMFIAKRYREVYNLIRNLPCS